MYKDLVEYIIRNLVIEPNEVIIEEETKDSGKKIIKVQVASNDMGRVIGKDGRIIRSVRNLVSAYAAKNKERISVEVLEAKKDVKEE